MSTRGVAACTAGTVTLARPCGAGLGDFLRDTIGERGRDLTLDASFAHMVQLLDDPHRELVG